MKALASTKLPEFREVPKSFSGFSKLLEIKNEDYRSGIILPSLEDVEIALRIFNGDRSAESAAMATQQNLEMDTLRHQGPVGFVILKQAEQKIAEGQEGIVDSIIKKAKKGINQKAEYHESFDYDAMGTNFFKTDVDIKKIGDKFLLSFNAAYVGKKPEDELAKSINAEQVLRNSKIILTMGIVDEWWLNADLEGLLRDTGILEQTRSELAVLADYEASMSGGISVPDFEYKGMKFSMGLDIKCFSHAITGKNTREKKFLIIDKSRIIGPAWRSFRSENNEPQPVDIEIALYSLGESSHPEKLLDKQYCQAMIEARDYLSEKIAQNSKHPN